MDENRNTGSLPETEQDLLMDPVMSDEILADEMAMAAAGLTHPNNAETDRIIEEITELTESEDIPEEYFPEISDELIGQDPAEISTQPQGQQEYADSVYSDAPAEEYADEPEEYQEEPAQPKVRKGRPKRKSGYGLLGLPHIFSTLVWLAIVVAIGVSLGRVAWVCASDVLGFSRQEVILDEKTGQMLTIDVTIDETDTIEDIALKLQDAGLISYPKLFELYASMTDAREDISAGTFSLNPAYDYHALVNSMTYYSAMREEITVMIPEGYTCAQIFDLLAEKGVCSAAEIEAYAKEGELDEYWFLEGVDRTDANCLEGFLFPDTYNFYIDDNPETVLEKMLDNFDYRFDEEYVAKIDNLNAYLTQIMTENGKDEAYIQENLLDVREVITVASLIEKETSGAEESPVIASVIYNRLYDWGDTPRFLNIDAALMYVLGHKEVLTTEDLQTDSPYNTYTNTGLVPGPIANPGLSSIEAALSPADTDYYYYVLDPSIGEHLFAATAAEHDANVAKVSQGG